ncbi:MAG: ATPase [Planctomycetaceae bacterium]|nr:ATPase [Planctomycetaceae bacterium]
MSTAPGKLSPAEFLAELQTNIGRLRAAGPATGAAQPLVKVASSATGADSSIAAALFAPEPADSEPTDAAVAVAELPAEAVTDNATPPATEPSEPPASARNNAAINGLLSRVDNLLSPTPKPSDGPFVPKAPESLDAAGLTFEDIERLILKFLLSRGSATGRAIASQISLAFMLVEPILKSLKHEQLVVFKSSAAMGDYEYLLTDNGRDRARRYVAECTYFGSATVTLKDYLKAMAAQSIAKQHATEADLHRAFSDLIINERMLDRLGPAINSGRGMFLFGEPGNGKTSIAERITSCFGSTIWIPKALGIDGDIIRLFDPSMHQAIKQEQSAGLLDNSNIDQRWVQIKRPTIVAGGELTMVELEVRQNLQTKVCESPLQLKSNCGTFVIDDFGRQRMPVAELLNRWIVPLEKRYDFLNLPSGKKVQVPFDQLIIFSTNLEPKDLVDGAFLRRIPYKIEVADPSEDEFRRLFAAVAPSQGFQLDRESIEALDYLIATHYLAKKRPFRACQPRDLLLQVRNFCLYKSLPRKVSPAAFDFACENYFSVM